MLRFMLIAALVTQFAVSAVALEPIPEKLVVLTFDDSVKSHFTVVRPVLLKYGFGATFFITEGFDFPTNKDDYMTWEQIKQLHTDGFEIGNHTRDHMGVSEESLPKLQEQLDGINRQCEAHDIPVPTSFAYPGNSIYRGALEKLREYGIRFARRGGAPEYAYDIGRGFAYEPGLDSPLLIPSAGDARPDWELEDFVRSVKQARQGRIAVLQFHGVPDNAHPWVHTAPKMFDFYMNYLATHDYQVIAVRDLAKYVDPDIMPSNPDDVITDRKLAIERGQSRDKFRSLPEGPQRRAWLENMAVYHQFSVPEIGVATGLPSSDVVAELKVARLAQSAVSREKAKTPRLPSCPIQAGAILASVFSTAPFARSAIRSSAFLLLGTMATISLSIFPRLFGGTKAKVAACCIWHISIPAPRQLGWTKALHSNRWSGLATLTEHSKTVALCPTRYPSEPRCGLKLIRCGWSSGSPMAPSSKSRG